MPIPKALCTARRDRRFEALDVGQPPDPSTIRIVTKFVEADCSEAGRSPDHARINFGNGRHLIGAAEDRGTNDRAERKIAAAVPGRPTLIITADPPFGSVNRDALSDQLGWRRPIARLERLNANRDEASPGLPKRDSLHNGSIPISSASSSQREIAARSVSSSMRVRRSSTPRHAGAAIHCRR